MTSYQALSCHGDDGHNNDHLSALPNRPGGPLLHGLGAVLPRKDNYDIMVLTDQGTLRSGRH
eukprot:7753805-Pyramimonas_sp.AAC.1